MGYSFENYLAALLWDLQILISPKDWLRRHAPLFGRYVDVCRLCSRLEEGNASVCARASKLAGEELDSPAEADALYSLKSVFGRLRVEKVSPVVPRYYSPAPLSLTNAFPVEDKKKPDGSVLTALDRELERAAQNPPEKAEDFAILLDTLFKKHLWCVPAAKGEDIDISLYDRMKSTAAISVCLERSGESHQPFLLLAADFSGIQNYIFTVARTNNKGVAKRLRARSFLVDVMIQSLAYQVCDEMQLPYGNILMLTGGKFYLLLPNQPETVEKLHHISEGLENDLFERFYGEISVNLAWVTFGDSGLTDYSSTITELSRRLRREKSRAFSTALTGGTGWREERFILTNDLAGKRSCPSCGRRLMNAGQEVCSDCKQQEKLGGKLANAETLWFSREGGEFRLWENSYISFSQSQAKGVLTRVEQLNRWDIPSDMTCFPLAVRLMANHLPKAENGEPMTFSDIADLSSGSKRLAVLKADVDNLGYLFADGMREETRHYGTISRVSTLSRLLEIFFSGYISHLLNTEYTNVYSVFSGGDDLFLIGPWDVMPEMALSIQKKFREFSGDNPCVTLSAAVYTVNPKTNIALLAENSEHELKRVKNSSPKALYPEKEGRNGISFLGDILSWEDLDRQLDNIQKLRPAVGKVNINILRRIGQYSEMYRRFLEDHDVLGLMFEPLLHYDQTRNYNNHMPEFFLQYVKDLPKNAADYRTVNKNLYFGKTVVNCILNQTKEER